VKHLIIPDTHGNKFYHFDRLVTHLKNGYNIVCLGDEFDSFDKKLSDQLEIFKNLTKLKHKYPKQVILLWGNHTYQYSRKFNPDLIPLCSGFQENRKYIIADEVDKHFDKFQFAYQYKNYLFTHAGLSNTYLQYLKDKVGIKGGNLIINIEELLNYPHQEHNWASGYNGGRDRFDGIMWIRPTQLNKDLPEGIKQIVGHTKQENGIWITDDVIYCDAEQTFTIDL